MRFRRFAAAVLTLPLLHLNVARVAIACEPHEQGGSPGVEQHVTQAPVAHAPEHLRTLPHHAHATAADEAHDSHSADPEPHDERSRDAAAECCRALASCSLAFGVHVPGPLGPQALIHERVSDAVDDSPRFAISSPEPPPPRA